MKRFHLLHALVPVLILVTNRGISAVGKAGPARGSSLGSEAPTNVAYQSSSPAELEEQEEEDGNQEQVLDQASPVRISTQIPVEVAAPAVGESSLGSSPAQNPIHLAWTDAVSQISADSSVQQAAPQQPVLQQGPRVESPSRQFLSYAETSGRPQEELPEESHEMSSLQASNAVEPLSGAVPHDRAPARPVDLGLSALSSTAPSMQSKAKPERASPRPFAATVPGLSNSDSAIPVRSAKLPQSMAKPPLSFVSAPKNNFPATLKETSKCHPPCIQGRGICNDNLCFCKTPYTGTTCQHKLSSYSRIKYPMLVAASIVCLVFGILFAQILHGFVTSRIEKRLVWLGDGMVKQEIWMPPDNAKGKKKGGP
jgi:hypothetical protein